MKHYIYGLMAGGLILCSCSEAAAFGRGAPPHPGGGAPPRMNPGGFHPGGAAGGFGGVHAPAYSPPHVSYSPPHYVSPPRGPAFPSGGGVPHGTYVPPREMATRPYSGAVTPPWAGVHPGGVGTPGSIAGHPGTAAPGGYHGGLVISPHTGAGGGFRPGAAAGGDFRMGHYTRYISPSNLHSIGLDARATRYPYFTRDWYRNHLGVWLPPLWAAGAGAWFVPPWDTLGPFVGISDPPMLYDYGSTAVIQDGSMYLNGDDIGTAADYAAQALAFADAGRAAMPADSDQWQPLGVFSLVQGSALQGSESSAQRIFQLAVNKNGIVRGTYYDAVADTTLPIYGELDKKTQRVAWSIGERKDIVFEAGLNNLIQNEAPVLVHYGKESTQQMVLVRLAEPQEK